MAILERGDEDLIATDVDLQRAVRTALGRVNLTFEELSDRARSGELKDEAQRMTWMAVCDLGEYA